MTYFLLFAGGFLTAIFLRILLKFLLRKLSYKPEIQINLVDENRVRLVIPGWELDDYVNVRKFEVPRAKILLRKSK